MNYLAWITIASLVTFAIGKSCGLKVGWGTGLMCGIAFVCGIFATQIHLIS